MDAYSVLDSGLSLGKTIFSHSGKLMTDIPSRGGGGEG